MVIKQVAEKFGVSLSTAKRKIEDADPAVPFIMKGIKDSKNRVVEQKDYKLADVKALFVKSVHQSKPRTKKPTPDGEGY